MMNMSQRYSRNMTKDKKDIIKAINLAIRASKDMESEAEEGWSCQMQSYDTAYMTSLLKEIKCMVNNSMT